MFGIICNMLMFVERSKVVEKRVQNVTINFGPQHPAAHGVLRLVLTLDGEVRSVMSVTSCGKMGHECYVLW